MAEDLESGHDTGLSDGLPQQPSPFRSNTRVILLKYYVRGRPGPRDVSQKFITWLTETFGGPSSRWQFSPEKLPDTHKAQRDIFVISVLAELMLMDGEHVASDNFQDFRQVLRTQEPPFLQGEASAPLFLLFSTPESEESIISTYTGAEVLRAFPNVRKEGQLGKTKSSLGDAVIEAVIPVAGISLAAYGCYNGLAFLGSLFKSSDTPAATSNTNDSPTATSSTNDKNVKIEPSRPKQAGWKETIKETTRTIEETAQNIREWANLLVALEPVRQQASRQSSSRDKLISMEQFKCRLLNDCEQVERDFDTLTAGISILFPPGNDDDHRAIPSSTEEILEVTQLLMDMSNSQLAKKETLNELFPLLEKKYSGSKVTCHGVAACSGSVVAVAVLAAALAPGFVATLWGGAWFISQGTLALSCSGVAGAATAIVSGTMASINNQQCKRRDNVRANHINVLKARYQLLHWLVIEIIGPARFKLLGEREKLEIYQKTGIQADLVANPNYVEGGVYTGWQELKHTTREYLQSCKDLANDL